MRACAACAFSSLACWRRHGATLGGTPTRDAVARRDARCATRSGQGVLGAARVAQAADAGRRVRYADMGGNVGGNVYSFTQLYYVLLMCHVFTCVYFIRQLTTTTTVVAYCKFFT